MAWRFLLPSIFKKYSVYWSWFLAFGWVAAIYLSVGFVRSVDTWLKQWPAYPFFIVLVCLLFLAVFIVISLKKQTLKSRQWVLFGLVAVFYIATFFYIKIPAERVHLVQYGLCSVLFYRALRNHMPSTRAVVFSWILSSLAGLLDEIIQGQTQGRYFGWWDVLLNCWSAALALGLVKQSSDRV